MCPGPGLDWLPAALQGAEQETALRRRQTVADDQAGNIIDKGGCPLPSQKSNEIEYPVRPGRADTGG